MSAPAYSPVSAARTLLRTARTAALASLDAASGAPFASLVTIATAPDGAPVMLLSTLAVHTRNLLQDPRASILIDDRSTFGGNDALAGSRLTVAGRVVAIAAADGPEVEAIARRRFLARHPEAEGYAGFRDFALYRLDVETAHLVAGFGRINDIAAADLLTDVDGADGLIAAEPDILAHMNADHAETTRRYAAELLHQPDAAWSVIGCDPDGLDLAANIAGRWHDARLVFPVHVRGAGPLRAILKELASNMANADGSGSN
jgi:putative heme iron utilization protein